MRICFYGYLDAVELFCFSMVSFYNVFRLNYPCLALDLVIFKWLKPHGLTLTIVLLQNLESKAKKTT